MSASSLPTIPQMEPWFDQSEARAVYEYMMSGGWVTEYSKTREFEASIARFTGAAFCSVVPNGTISLALALMACGVGPGDEVIVPDFTMAATPNAARLCGASVVFVDIEPDTLCMDYRRMCQAVSPRTRAVLLVTINGRAPGNLQAFVDFCAQRRLWLIEDAAQSLGSRHAGRHLGTFGAIGCLSFSAMKVISTGQGGALVTDDERLIQRVRMLRDFGRTRGGEDHYLTLGWNFKFTDLQAVVGLEQMKKLAWRVERKKQMYALYRQGLAGLAGIALLPTDLADTSPWFMDILVGGGQRESLMAFLKAQGIQTRPFYPALHAEPAYALAGTYPVAERVAREGLWLPSSSRLTDGDVRRVCDAIRNWSERSPG